MHSNITIGLITFVCTFGGAMAGMRVRAALPQHHLSSETKEVVKLGMGLVGTMTALILGLLVASAKSYFDTQSTEVVQISANVALFDRILAHYGPETKEARGLLREACEQFLQQAWSSSGAGAAPPPAAAQAPGEQVFERVEALSPSDDRQRALKAQALTLVASLGQMRWLMYEQSAAGVSLTLLVALVFWLTITFISFGLFAPSNGTVIASFLVSALSVAAALYLIVELYRPYSGLVQISSAPLRAAIAQLGR